MANRFTRVEVLLQLLVNDSGHSEKVGSGDVEEGTNTYISSQVVDPDAVKAQRSAVASNNLACS